MLGGEYGDNLIIANLVQHFQRPVTVLSKESVRTWLPNGEEKDGMNTDAIWVAHAGEQNGVHYYGILRASMLAEQGEGKDETPRLRIRRKTPAVEQPVGADPYAALDNCLIVHMKYFTTFSLGL